MKEVITINIGGSVFSIEKKAYHILNTYLEEIRIYFKGEEVGKDVLEDIEASIAEKFLKKKKNIDHAVQEKDVELVIKQMGHVEDFQEGDDAADSFVKNHPRRLYRDSENGLIGGVAAGIANYFGIDPVFSRLVFIFFVFWGGFGLLMYVVLWVIVPKAETAGQKLEANGKPINIKGIKQYVEKKLEAVPAGTIWHKLYRFPVLIASYLLLFIRKIAPILRIMGGGFVTLASVGMLFVFSTLFMAILFGQLDLRMDARTSEILADIIEQKDIFMPFLMGLGVCILIPLVFFLLGGISLLLKRNLLKVWVVIPLVFVWIGSLSFTTVKAVQHSSTVNKVIHVFETEIEKNPDHNFYIRINGEELWNDDMSIPINEDFYETY